MKSLNGIIRNVPGACLLLVLASLTGCSDRTVQINLVPTSDDPEPQLVTKEPHWFVSDRIVILDINGLLTDSGGGLVGPSHNPVSDLRHELDEIAADDSDKAVVLRMNTPGGTVTASDMMYREILAFKAKTHKPVVVSMMDVCASGGFYISCAGDYRFAYPTTVTGSIGVIVQTFNISRTLNMIGVTPFAVTSGPNKDEGSPFRPMNANDKRLFE